MDFNIGGVEVAILVIGIVEFLKNFGLDGKANQVAALVLGFFFFGLAEAIAQDLLSQSIVPYVVVGVKALAASLSAMGYFELVKRTKLIG